MASSNLSSSVIGQLVDGHAYIMHVHMQMQQLPELSKLPRFPAL